MNKPGSFEKIDNKLALPPGMQVSIRQGTIAFTAGFKAAQAARYVQILVDSDYKRLAFLFTQYQGEGNFALVSDGKPRPTKVTSCTALFRAHPWIAQGRFNAKVDHRGYWIVEISEPIKVS